jgi:hypothetical protein
MFTYVTGQLTVSRLRWLVAVLSQRNHGFSTGSVQAGLLADKMALGQVFLLVLRFYAVNIIQPWFSILIYHLGGDQ